VCKCSISLHERRVRGWKCVNSWSAWILVLLGVTILLKLTFMRIMPFYLMLFYVSKRLDQLTYVENKDVLIRLKFKNSKFKKLKLKQIFNNFIISTNICVIINDYTNCDKFTCAAQLVCLNRHDAFFIVSKRNVKLSASVKKKKMSLIALRNPFGTFPTILKNRRRN